MDGKWKIAMRPVFAALACLVIFSTASCDDGAPPPANSAEGTEASAMEGRLESLSEGQRDAVFMRALRDSGSDGQHVESSERAGDSDGLPVWRARCEQGKSYTIVITAGGTAQVLDDRQVRLSPDAAKDGGRGQ